MDAQLGWLNCKRCSGLVNVNAGQGSCFDGQVHDFMFGADYRVRWSSFPDNVQRGWAVCNRCSRLVCRLVAPGVCFDGQPHTFDDFSPEYGVQFGAAGPDTQAGWRWCNRCQCLWDTNNATTHACVRTADLVQDHEQAASFEYVASIVTVGLQTWWVWCDKCQSLVRSPNVGRCQDGSIHNWGDSATYALPYGTVPANAQEGWRACSKCGVLVNGGAGGACWAGGGHEFGTLVYSVLLDTVPDGAQPGWKWCSKCMTLAYVEFVVGPCPAGGTHDHAQSGSYAVFPETLQDGQPGWRRCGKCASIAFIQLSGGMCRDGSAHDVAESAAYSVPKDVVPIGAESSWRRCARCQVLVFQSDTIQGVCVDGVPHELGDSALYGVPFDEAPDGAEIGWQRCSRCGDLVFAAAATTCPDGGPHDFSGTLAYKLAKQPARQPAPPEQTGPSIAVTESETQIVVEGSGFAPSGSVKLSFVAGAATVKADVAADAEGRFRHVVDTVVPRAEGGLVLAAQADEPAATGRLHSFFPAAQLPSG